MNAADLKRKNLIPSYAFEKAAINELDAQFANESKWGTRGYRCKECGIEIQSKELMKQHVKIHWTMEQRENETPIVRVNPY